jgi:CelD/BcsL family acetyltransferase involved in cellulose biosynthesis
MMLPRLAILHERGALHGLRDEWERLQDDSASDSFFASWTWCDAWLAHHPDESLALITARDPDGALIGLAPLSVTRVRAAPGVTLARLGFIGAAAPVEHFDFIVPRGREHDVLPAMLAHLNEIPHDVLSLANILPESPSLASLRGGGLEESDGHSAPVLDLPEDLNAVLAKLQKKKNERFRYYRRRIDRDFANDWSCTTASTPAEVDEAFDVLMRLHQQHWTTRGEPGAFADTQLTAFYRDLAHRLAARGWLRMYRLIAKGAFVSVDFAFLYRRRFHHFINGTDFDSGVDSPGAVLHSCMIERCIAEGTREYDMMWGEHDYKYDWGARRRVDRTFTRDATARARMIKRARGVLGALRKVIGAASS